MTELLSGLLSAVLIAITQPATQTEQIGSVPSVIAATDTRTRPRTTTTIEQNTIVQWCQCISNSDGTDSELEDCDSAYNPDHNPDKDYTWEDHCSPSPRKE